MKMLQKLAFTVAYGDLGEACGAKLAFEGAFLIFATFSQYFNKFFEFLKLTEESPKLKLRQKSEKIVKSIFFSRNRNFFSRF